MRIISPKFGAIRIMETTLQKAKEGRNFTGVDNFAPETPVLLVNYFKDPYKGDDCKVLGSTTKALAESDIAEYLYWDAISDFFEINRVRKLRFLELPSDVLKWFDNSLVRVAKPRGVKAPSRSAVLIKSPEV